MAERSKYIKISDAIRDNFPFLSSTPEFMREKPSVFDSEPTNQRDARRSALKAISDALSAENIAGMLSDPLNAVGMTSAAKIARTLAPVAALTYSDDAEAGPLSRLAARLGKNAAPIRRGVADVTAWHGSPHEFDKFDLSKLGTGDGLQAFGKGMYLAENPRIAKVYQDGAVRKGDARGGFIYKTDIPDHLPERMLDWNKALDEQHPHVLEKLTPIISAAREKARKSITLIPPRMPEELMTHAKYSLGIKEPEATLNELGVPGIKYLDSSSLAKGEGTRNYVVFDPDHIRILERNGEATGAKPWAEDGYANGGLVNNPLDVIQLRNVISKLQGLPRG